MKHGIFILYQDKERSKEYFNHSKLVRFLVFIYKYEENNAKVSI